MVGYKGSDQVFIIYLSHRGVDQVEIVFNVGGFL